MKNIIIFLVLMTSEAWLYSQPQIKSYNIFAEYDTDNKNISITNKVLLEFVNPAETAELLFNSSNVIKSIKDDKNSSLNYRQKGQDTLVINFGKPYSGSHKISFEYIYPTDDTIILLDRGHRWYPMIADNIVTFNMEIKVLMNYLAVTAGAMESEQYGANWKILKYKTSVPVFKIPLFITPTVLYSVKESQCGNIKSSVYLLKNGNISASDSLSDDICKLISYFNSEIGDYRFDKFNLIETSKFDGANLGSSFITIGSNDLKYYISGNKQMLNMALASQWYGTCVFPKLFCKGFWFLSVSLPHYLRLMYIKDTKGEKEFNEEIEECINAYKKIEGSEHEVSILDVDYPNTKEKGVSIYAKGVLVLNKLKEQLGDTNWRNFLKDFYKEYNGKIINLDNFTNGISKFDTGGNALNNFLRLLSEKGL